MEPDWVQHAIWWYLHPLSFVGAESDSAGVEPAHRFGPRRPGWHVCPETIYEAVYHGHLRPLDQRRSTLLRTGRTYRRRRGRGRSREGALRQCAKARNDR